MMIAVFLLACYYVVANLTYVILFLLSNQMVRKRPANFIPLRKDWPELAVLISAYNEQEIISRSIHGLLDNPYPNLRIVVINDGSKDSTLQVLQSEFAMSLVNRSLGVDEWRSTQWPHMKVFDKPNSGKASSINLALASCSSLYCVTLDADTVVAKDAFFLAVTAMEEDPHAVAVGGSVRVLNGAQTQKSGVARGRLPRGHLAMFQVVEYIRAFFGGRLGWEYLGGTALLSGAFALFRTDRLKEIGGFDARSVTEDFEVVIRLKDQSARAGRKCRMHMIPAPTCWTLVPESVAPLFWQRARWQKGLVQTLWKHKWLIFNPRAGRMGFTTLPYMLIFEALSPLVELAGYFIVPWAIISGDVASEGLVIGLLAGLIFYTFVTLGCIRLEEMHYARHDTKKPRARFILYSFMEHFGYRQVLFAARLWGTVSAFKRSHSWGSHDRSQFEEHREAA